MNIRAGLGEYILQTYNANFFAFGISILQTMHICYICHGEL